MPTRAQKIRLGIFFIIGSIALVVLIAVFTSQRLFQKKDIYYIAYEGISVSGLDVGSAVKYLGIKVGSIENIQIDPTDVNRIIVEVALEPGTPIKKDARAAIASVGITGLKMVEIRGSSNEAALLTPGKYIKPGTSITQQITGKAEVIAEKLESLLNNLHAFAQPENLQKITIMSEKAATAFDQMGSLLDENRIGIAQTVVSMRQISTRLDTTSQILLNAAGNFDAILQSDTLVEILSNTRDISLKLRQANLLNLIKELGEVIHRTNRLLIQIDHDLERGSLDFSTSMKLLKNTLQNLNETSRLIQDDPSVLIRGTKYKDIPDKHLDDD